MRVILKRKNIFYDEVGIDTEEIKQSIPEMEKKPYQYLTPEQIEAQKNNKNIYYHFYDYSVISFMRPNHERLAADEFSITDIAEDSDGDSGTISFVRNKNGNSYSYSWGPDYDGCTYEDFYKGDSLRVYDSESIGITIPTFFFEVPGQEYPGSFYEEEVCFGDLKIWFQECIAETCRIFDTKEEICK